MLKDLLFPKFCVGCGFLGTYICISCRRCLLLATEDICIYCKKRSFRGLTHPGCRKHNGVDGFISCFIYNKVLRKIIKQVKYRLAKEVFHELLLSAIPLEFIYKLSMFKNEPWNLQSIPLYEKREKHRGFNQAEIIKNFLLLYLKISISTSVLIRIRNTFPQAQILSKKQKYKNIQGAFKETDKKKIFYKNFILVDDIVTTGNTVKEACRILKKSGANKVFIISLARS